MSLTLKTTENNMATKQPDIETVLKALDRLTAKARRASKLSPAIDEKLRFQKLVKLCEVSRHDLRLEWFAFEDSEALNAAHPAEHCQACSQEVG